MPQVWRGLRNQPLDQMLGRLNAIGLACRNRHPDRHFVFAARGVAHHALLTARRVRRVVQADQFLDDQAAALIVSLLARWKITHCKLH